MNIMLHNVTKSVNHRWLLILLHGIISLLEATSCDKLGYVCAKKDILIVQVKTLFERI